MFGGHAYAGLFGPGTCILSLRVRSWALHYTRLSSALCTYVAGTPSLPPGTSAKQYGSGIVSLHGKQDPVSHS